MIFTAEARLFITIIVVVLAIATLILARIHVWKNAATLTWDYFWRHAVPGASDPGMTQEEIYQQALLDTKRYMRDTVWPEFARMWEENPWSQLVPPEWLK